MGKNILLYRLNNKECKLFSLLLSSSGVPCVDREYQGIYMPCIQEDYDSSAMIKYGYLALSNTYNNSIVSHDGYTYYIAEYEGKDSIVYHGIAYTMIYANETVKRYVTNIIHKCLDKSKRIVSTMEDIRRKIVSSKPITKKELTQYLIYQGYVYEFGKCITWYDDIESKKVFKSLINGDTDVNSGIFRISGLDRDIGYQYHIGVLNREVNGTVLNVALELASDDIPGVPSVETISSYTVNVKNININAVNHTDTKATIDTDTGEIVVYRNGNVDYKTKGLLCRDDKNRLKCLVGNMDGVYQFMSIYQLPMFDKVLNVIRYDIKELQFDMINENCNMDDDDTEDYKEYMSDYSVVKNHNGRGDVITHLYNCDSCFINVYRGKSYYGGYSEYTGAWLAKHIVTINNYFVKMGLVYLYNITRIAMSPYAVYNIWIKDNNWGIQRVPCKFAFDNGVIINVIWDIPSSISQNREHYDYDGDYDGDCDRDYENIVKTFQSMVGGMLENVREGLPEDTVRMGVPCEHNVYTPISFRYTNINDDSHFQQACKIHITFPSTSHGGRRSSLDYYIPMPHDGEASVNVIEALQNVYEDYSRSSKYNKVFNKKRQYIVDILKKYSMGGYSLSDCDKGNIVRSCPSEGMARA